MPEDVRAGHPTFWQSFGTGSRAALAIHCSLASSNAWADVMRALDDKITLAAFDMPGHGRSADWEGTGDFLTETARIAASFVTGPVDLIGHSFGAVVALRLAEAAPEAIRTLTLIEPVLFAAARGSVEWDLYQDHNARFGQMLAEGKRAAAAEAFTAMWGTGADWAGMDERSRNEITRRIHLVGAETAALFEDSGGILDPDRLEMLDMPVLLIRGDASPAIIETITENIAARLPDVGVATVPGAGHMLPLTHPAEVAGLIGVNLDRG
ncbi:MAG: alpha/beta hydrolase [Rhodobacteraceae bacterium]|nr:alpha/beta hydrolase [Paracoccaceae bacterium]